MWRDRLATKLGVTLTAAAAMTFAAGVSLADHHKNDGGKSKGGDKKQADKAGGDMKDLEVELPEAQFDGTPKDLPPGLNLDPKRVKRVENQSKSRKPIQVPKDVKLVSRDKPVTMSAEWSIMGEPALITDGDKAAAPGSFLELGPGKKWVQIDLKKPYKIHAIVVWHFHQQARVYRDVVVQVSSDKDFKKNVTTVFNNDSDNSLGLGAGEDYEYLENNEGRLIKVDGVKGRYVRLYSKGNTSNRQNHYTEVEVFGTKAGKSTADKNAGNKTAKADK
jgi:hypothetical protein